MPLPQATSINCCNAFVRAWLSRYGSPKSIFCDNGNTFTANLWKDLTKLLGIEVKYVPPEVTLAALEQVSLNISSPQKISDAQKSCPEVAKHRLGVKPDGVLVEDIDFWGFRYFARFPIETTRALYCLTHKGTRL